MLGQRPPPLRRVAHAIDSGAQAQFARRAQQKLVQLGGALLIAPVADPDQIALRRRCGERAEEPRVGRLVPDPGAPRPALAQVEVSAISEG